MTGINCQLIVCILALLINNMFKNSKGRIHLDSYMWTLVKATASLSAAI